MVHDDRVAEAVELDSGSTDDKSPLVDTDTTLELPTSPKRVEVSPAECPTLSRGASNLGRQRDLTNSHTISKGKFT